MTAVSHVGFAVGLW